MPYQVVKSLESKISEYTGAPYVVTTNSCTMALFLCCAYFKRFDKGEINIPKRTYVSVPQLIKQAGYKVEYRDYTWSGEYQLMPLPIFDSARRFTSGMFKPGKFQCLSFHASKILGDTQGGAIIHDNPKADEWFRKARFDGRTEGVAPIDDQFDMLGYHCYMSPDVAARLLLKMYSIPEHNEDLPNDDYPDLSQIEVFK